MQKISRLSERFLFPENLNCIYCNDSISSSNPYSLCHDCYRRVEFTELVCSHCGRQVHEEKNCFCMDETYHFDWIDTCITYNTLAQKLIFRYKYGQKTYLAYFFAQLLSERLEQTKRTYDYIMYIPIHKSREKERGFNQMRLISEILSKKHQIPVLDMVSRKKKTPFLSKKTSLQRMLLLEDAFEVRDVKIFEQARILLLDDIVTSAATFSMVAKEIKKAEPTCMVEALAICNART